MWRRALCSQLKTLFPCRSSLHRPANRDLVPHPVSSRLFSGQTSEAAKTIAKTVSDLLFDEKRVEDVMPIATGHEREELEAQLKGKDILEINYPVGPFGTKEAPAVVKAYYDRRIVGCPGGEGEDEHDVVWFWLEKGKPHECPVCTQYFVLDVVGPGGDPEEGHHDHHH